MKKVFTISVAVIVSMLFVAGSALAWSVDFRDPYYQATNGQASFNSPQDDLTLTAFPTPAYLTWNAGDGLGVGGVSYEEDEVEFPEFLEIMFDNSVLLGQVLVTNLFNEGYLEHGMFRVLIGGTWSQLYDFFADPSQLPDPISNGELIVDMADYFGGAALLEGIRFGAWGTQDPQIPGDHEFSVAALNIVPEPGTMLLLGAGLIGLLGLVRKRAKK